MLSTFSFALYLEPHHSSNEANSTDTTYGFVACAFAVLLYGSYFVPVKTIDTGDGEEFNCTFTHHTNILPTLPRYAVLTGMFFQWICSSAIWCVGLVADTLLHPSRAHPAAMLGGVLWATGKVYV